MTAVVIVVRSAMTAERIFVGCQTTTVLIFVSRQMTLPPSLVVYETKTPQGGFDFRVVRLFTKKIQLLLFKTYFSFLRKLFFRHSCPHRPTLFVWSSSLLARYRCSRYTRTRYYANYNTEA